MWTRNKLKKKMSPEDIKEGLCSCAVSLSAPAALYMESFHVEVPASSTEPQRAPTAQSVQRWPNQYFLSSRLLSAGCGGLHSMLERTLATWGWGWGATTRHIITAQTKPFAFSCILCHSWLQVMQCPLSKFKEFIVVPVSVDGTDFLCTVVKHPKVACERSNTAWIQKLRLFNECVQRCIIPVRENLRHMLDRWDGKGAFTAGN